MSAFVPVRRILASSRSLLLCPDSRSSRNAMTTRIFSTIRVELKELGQDERESNEVEATLMAAAQKSAVRELQRQLEKEKARSAYFEQLAKDREKELECDKEVLAAYEKTTKRYEKSVIYCYGQYIRREGRFAAFKAVYGPETNIGPVIEAQIRDWFGWGYAPSKTVFESEEALDAFVGLLSSNDPDDKMHKLRLVASIDKAAELGQINDVDKHRIEYELKNFSDKLHEDMNGTEQDLPRDLRPGFVVYGDDTYVTAAASTFLIFFGYSHTAISKCDKKILYTFDEREL